MPHHATPPESGVPGAGRLGPPRQIKWLETVIGLLLSMNLIDLILTLFWVEAGYADEANPLMAVLFAWGPVAFACIKLGLVSAGCYLLWLRRTHVWGAAAIFLGFIAYYSVMVRHADGLGQLLSSWVR